MTVSSQTKAKTASTKSRQSSRSKSAASDHANEIDDIFGSLGQRSRTRSASASASGYGKNNELAQHLQAIAVKKETNAKKQSKTLLRKDQKSKAILPEQGSSSTEGSQASQDYGDSDEGSPIHSTGYGLPA